MGAHAAAARGEGRGYDDVEVVSAGDSLDGHLLQSMHPHRPAQHATPRCSALMPTRADSSIAFGPCPRNVPLPATAGGGLARHVRVDACLLRPTKLPMLAAAPRVKPAVARDAQRMRSTACDVRDLLAFRHHHERRHGHAPTAAEPQLPVVARPPRVHLRAARSELSEQPARHCITAQRLSQSTVPRVRRPEPGAATLLLRRKRATQRERRRVRAHMQQTTYACRSTYNRRARVARWRGREP